MMTKIYGMPLSERTVSRRSVLVGSLAGLGLGIVGVSKTAEAKSAFTVAPASEADWLNVLATHRDTVSLSITTIDGAKVSHRADCAQQPASAIKVFHLAAYAQAVARGTLNPNQQVPIREWERWYYPSDGGAHAKALKRLKIPAQGNSVVAVAADSKATIKLDDIVSAMIQESDNAAADYLRELIGSHVLRRVIAGLGARHTVTPTLLGANIQATHASLAGQDAETLVARYRSDEAFALSLLDMKQWSGYDAQAAYFATHGVKSSAADLARVYEAVAAGTVTGADTMRRHLEWASTSPKVRTGFKGGSLPGVLTIGVEQRLPGTNVRAHAALMMSGLSEQQALSTNFDWQKILLDAMSDSTYARQVQSKLTGTSGTTGPLGPKVQTDYVH